MSSSDITRIRRARGFLVGAALDFCCCVFLLSSCLWKTQPSHSTRMPWFAVAFLACVGLVPEGEEAEYWGTLIQALSDLQTSCIIYCTLELVLKLKLYQTWLPYFWKRYKYSRERLCYCTLILNYY